MSKEFANLAKLAPTMLLAALLLPIAGCWPEASPPEDDSSISTPEISDPSSTTLIVFGIGDVETSMEMTLSVDRETDLTDVRVEEAQTKNEKLAKVRVTLRKPYPEELNLVLKINSYDNFVGHAVQVVPHVFFDDKDVELAGFIYGNRAVLDRREYRINVLEYLEGDLSSALVHVELEINLFLNTDESEITLETPPTELTQSVTKLSNPVRIDFVP